MSIKVKGKEDESELTADIEVAECYEKNCPFLSYSDLPIQSNSSDPSSDPNFDEDREVGNIPDTIGKDVPGRFRNSKHLPTQFDEDEPELTDDTEIVDCYDENCIFDFLLPESTSDPNSDENIGVKPKDRRLIVANLMGVFILIMMIFYTGTDYQEGVLLQNMANLMGFFMLIIMIFIMIFIILNCLRIYFIVKLNS